jgi:L-ascorbate metabolism protein UlaG (beta-lactamase superfamily)
MKIKLFILVLMPLVLSQCKAQQLGADEIKTNNGILKIQPVMHASLVLTWNNKAVYVDPTGGAALYKNSPAPDMIIITDIHGDHMDAKTIAEVNTNKAILVVPQAVADMLPASAKDKLVILKNGETSQQLGVSITAIPMYNIPQTPTAFHTKGRGNGYVLNMGGKNIYISGDTQAIPEMLALKNIDVAFLCMNLPYTMEINEAAKAVLTFKPAIVYPYHYRGQDVNAFKKLVNDGDPKIDVRLREWYPK